MVAKQPQPGADWRRARIPLQSIDDPRAAARGVKLSLARLDRLHDQVSGNKWFKLLPNLARAQDQGYRRVISFGGPWSNHIHALAWAGQHYGLETVGVIRGYAHLPLTAMLEDARGWGMQLHFVDHRAYARKEQSTELTALQRRFGPSYLVPEGGCNGLGIEGCAQIWQALEGVSADYTSLVVAVGTGASLAGLLQAAQAPPRALGVSVLKGDDGARLRVGKLITGGLPRQLEWEVETRCHFGGYARVTPELKLFIEEFYFRHGVLLEPVYTAKMLYALFQRLERGWFAEGEHLLALHTGGLQGLRGYCSDWPWAAQRVAQWQAPG